MFTIVFFMVRQQIIQMSFNEQTQLLCCWFDLVNIFLLGTLFSVSALLHGEHRWAQPQDLPAAQALIALVEHSKLGDEHRQSIFTQQAMQAARELLDRECKHLYLL